MLKRVRYIIISALLLFSILKGAAQNTMPDEVCVGTTRTYQVNPTNPAGSTYTWTIDGVKQSSTTNKLIVPWDKIGTYLITVQERTADGCDGEVRSGVVTVNPLPTVTVPNASRYK